MLVAKDDGACRQCGGVLEIPEVDDATMLVECTGYGDAYRVEPDAFGDGGVHYYCEMQVEQEGLEDEPS